MMCLRLSSESLLRVMLLDSFCSGLFTWNSLDIFVCLQSSAKYLHSSDLVFPDLGVMFTGECFLICHEALVTWRPQFQLKGVVWRTGPLYMQPCFLLSLEEWFQEHSSYTRLFSRTNSNWTLSIPEIEHFLMTVLIFWYYSYITHSSVSFL